MTARLALLCSGQGAQHPGMFDLARTDAAASSLLDIWLAPLALTKHTNLFANRIAQPVLVAATCAIWVALRRHLPPAMAVAGYSVGEVAALAVAGVLDPADAVALANTRAGLMDACVEPGQPQGLLAVSGPTLQAVKSHLADLSADGIRIAIVNGLDQCILGGLRNDSAAGPGLETLASRLERLGAQVTLLPVAIASHTPWMQPAVAPLEAHVHELPRRGPQMRLLAGIDGQASTTGDAALTALLRQTVAPIRWDACMDALAEAGVTAALELGPGSALSRMLTARHSGIACRSVAEFRSVEGIRAWVGRQ